MPLRVIAGSAKGRKLKLVPGDSTRPVMDRVKEALFSIIGRDVLDADFLDLFAGTGSVGIEALSRGAKSTLFIDLDKRAIDTVQENLKVTGLADRAVIRRADAFTMLESSSPHPYHFIYVAPPQYKLLWQKTLQVLDDHMDWLASGGVVIVQIDPSEKQPLTLRHITVYDERRYGNTLLIFLTRTESIEPAELNDDDSGLQQE
jgi:16S rRNA (guanine(966)-N(2))-methyltransferase RsmD